MKAIGNEFQLRDCHLMFEIPIKSEEKPPEALLASWLIDKNMDSSFQTKSVKEPPRYSIISFETENSEMFSEKFSIIQKKSKSALKNAFKIPSKIMTSPMMMRKKLSNFEQFEIEEDLSEQMAGSALPFEGRKRAVTMRKKKEIIEIEEETVRIFFLSFFMVL